EDALVRPDDLVVVRDAGRRRQIRDGIRLEDVEPRLIERALRNPAEDPAVREAGRLIRRVARAALVRILDEVIEIAVVVQRLREVPLSLQLRREPVPLDLVAARARLELLGVEEEHSVLAARLANRTADRVSPVLLLQHRLRVAI